MLSISKLMKTASDCLQNVVEQWIGAIVFLILLVAGVILAFGYADTFIVMLTERKELAKNIAATIAFVFIALPLIPPLYDSMTMSPVGIVADCSVSPGQNDKVVLKGNDKAIGSPRTVELTGTGT